MAKLTVAEIRKKISALEAQAVRLAEEETRVSVGRVRALMNELGVTLEHLSSAVSRKASAVKTAIVGKKLATAKRSKGVAKYQDPRTGATWSGVGRAPGWIAGATNRDAFLVGKNGGKASESVVKPAAAKKKSAARKASARKAAKPAAKKGGAVAKKVAKAATSAAKKKPSAKKLAPKAAAKTAVKKRAAPGGAQAGLTAVEGGGPSAT